MLLAGGMPHGAPRRPTDSRRRWAALSAGRLTPDLFESGQNLAVNSAVGGDDRRRAEVDGRRHSMWRLSATITPDGTSEERTQLRMLLHYGGSLWTGGVVERVLHDEINRSRDRLLSLVDATTP